ncbi:MAG: hypothetical protein ACR2P4_01285 [Gammaproteobacteria bacterium]
MRQTQGGALSRFALCYNMPPFQGFYNAPPLAAMVWEIPAFAGMTGFLRGNDKRGGNDGMGGNDGFYGFPLSRE